MREQSDANPVQNIQGGVIINFQVCSVVPLRRGGLVGYLVRLTVRPKVVMTPVLAELRDGRPGGTPLF